MTLSAYFMSKSVFDVQGCRALILALARLSCIFCPMLCIALDRQLSRTFTRSVV